MWIRPAYKSLLLTVCVLPLTVHGVSAQTASATDTLQPASAEIQVNNSVFDAPAATPSSTTPAQPVVQLSRPGEKLTRPMLTAIDVPPPGTVVPNDPDAAPAPAPPIVTPAKPTLPVAPAPVAVFTPEPAPVKAAVVAPQVVKPHPHIIAKKPVTVPPPARKPIYTPSGEQDAAGITHYPITVKTTSESINPAVTPTGPAPNPDVAATLAGTPPPVSVPAVTAPPKIVPPAPVVVQMPAMPPMPPKLETETPSPSAAVINAIASKPVALPPVVKSESKTVVNKAMTPLPPTTSAKAVPPIPKDRPNVQQAPQSFVDKARKDLLLQSESQAMHKKYAIFPLKPARPGEVTVEPLPDAGKKIIQPGAALMLAPAPVNSTVQKMSPSDRATLVKAIEDIHASTVKSGQPIPPQVQTAQPAVMPLVQPTAVIDKQSAASDFFAKLMARQAAEKAAKQVQVKTVATAIPTPSPVTAAPAVMDLTAPVVKTPAEKIDAPDLTAHIAAPAAIATQAATATVAVKDGVPRVPPTDTNKQDRLTVPFKVGAEQIDPEITGILQSRVLPQLKAHPSWRMQILSYATSPAKEPVDARRISLSRALAIRSWLMTNGVEGRRIDLRAMGMETDQATPDRADIIYQNPEKN